LYYKLQIAAINKKSSNDDFFIYSKFCLIPKDDWQRFVPPIIFWVVCSCRHLS
jgi:hypothetical protein